jgi:peptidoglycan/LPS O-acetylase OafA/YrhL
VSNIKVKRNRLESIDFLPGIAALAVVLYHTTHNEGFLDPEGYIYNTFKYGGGVGVAVFFVISGYILPYSMHKANYKLKNYKAFFLKRVIRIEPVYIASIIFTIFVFYTCSQLPSEYWKHGSYTIDFINFLLHLGYLISFFSEQNWINPVFWSLGLEFQFYLIIGLGFPLFVMPNKYLTFTLTLLSVILFWWLFETAIKGTYLHYGGTVIRLLPMFYLGIALFQFQEKIIDKYLFVILLIVLLYFCYIEFKWSENLAAVFALIVIATMKRVNLIFLFLGKISFSLYLVHVPLGGFFILFIKHHFQDDLSRTIMALLTVIPIILVSYVFYVLIEAPCIKLTKKIKYNNGN